VTKLTKFGARSAFRLNLFITFAGFLDTHLLIPIIALYATKLGASVGVVGLIIGLYSITNTPANILVGRVIDRVGTKVPLIIGLLGDALAMFCYALCSLPLHLMLVRVFHGISGGLVGPATMSITGEHSSSHHRGRAMGFYGMSLAMATLVGYMLSAVLASRLGYEPIFYLGSAILILGVGAALVIPARRGRAFAPDQVSVGKDLTKMMELLKRRGLFASYCSVFAQYFAFGGVVTLLPLYIEGLGMEAFHTGMLLATFAATFILLQPASGALSDRVGRQAPAGAGLCLCIVSLAILPTMQSFATLAMVMVLYGASYALIFPSISALVADYTAIKERGRATGIFHALLTAGVAIGAPVMGWVGETAGIRLGLALSCVAAVLALIVVLTTLRPR